MTRAALALLLVAAPASAGNPWHHATATSFGPSATDSGNPNDTLACRYPARLQPGQRAAASYSLPCLTWIEVCHRDRCVTVQVLDRGPVRARPCSHPRARPGHCGRVHDLDLTRPVMLDLSGRQRNRIRVRWRVVEAPAVLACAERTP